MSEDPKDWFLMKRGLFYRPNAAGYTTVLAEAGRFTEAEAKKHVYPHDEPVTMHHITKFSNEIIDAVQTDINQLTEQVRVLKQSVDNAHTAMDESAIIFTRDKSHQGLTPRIKSIIARFNEKQKHIEQVLAQLAALNFIRPIETAPKDGKYIILFGPSGYGTTPLRCEICRHDAVYRPLQPWVNHSNDSFMDGGEAPTGWMPLPIK